VREKRFAEEEQYDFRGGDLIAVKRQPGDKEPATYIKWDKENPKTIGHTS